MDTVPVEVHEALKSAMDKLQVSKSISCCFSPTVLLSQTGIQCQINTTQAHCRGVSSRCSIKRCSTLESLLMLGCKGAAFVPQAQTRVTGVLSLAWVLSVHEQPR